MAKPDPSWRLFAAKTLLDRLQVMRDHVPHVRGSDDPEAVHQMRVASRRMRAALAVCDRVIGKKRRQAWRKAIRTVTASLGEARDLDVQILFVEHYLRAPEHKAHRLGVERLLLRLRQSRQRLQRKVVKAMDRFEGSDVVAGMSDHLHAMIVKANLDGAARVSRVMRAQARDQVLERLDELQAYRTYVNRPNMNEQLHEMRVLAKRLRYTLEVFAPTFENDALRPAIRGARRLQNQLGKLHDCDIWLERLPRFVERESDRHERFFGHRRGLKRLADGIEHLRAERAAERQRVYERFAEVWHKQENKGLWPDLRKRLTDAAREPDQPKPRPPAAPVVVQAQPRPAPPNPTRVVANPNPGQQATN